MYPAEVNSLSMRTKGAALATACDWLFNYFVVQTTPPGIHYLHWGLYLVYAILNASFVPLIFFFIVETAGKSLEQIDRWFAANPGWFVHKVRDGETSKLGFLKPNGHVPGRRSSEDDAEARAVRAPLKHAGSGESESMVKDFERRYDGSLERSRKRSESKIYRVGSHDEEDLGDRYDP